MRNRASGIFNLNGVEYQIDKLTSQGKKLLELLSDVQNDLNRIENQKLILQSAQKELIDQLKAILPASTANRPMYDTSILGKCSKEVPITPAIPPEEEVAEFPSAMKQDLKNK